MIKDYPNYSEIGEDVAALAKETLSIASWNIWWQYGPWQQREPLIIEVLQTTNADIYCLQEVWRDGGTCQAEKLAEALGLYHNFAPLLSYEGIELGVAVLTKWPIVSSQAIRLLPEASDDGSTDCVALRVRVVGPKDMIDVYCTHLSWRREHSLIRQLQVRALLEFVDETHDAIYPPVICGDFNALPSSDEIRMLTGEVACPVEGMVFNDAWKASGHKTEGYTWDIDNSFTHQGMNPNRRIDYIFVGLPGVGGRGQLLDAKLIGNIKKDKIYPSDHYGINARLRY